MAEDNTNLLIGRLEGKMDLMVSAVNNLSSSFESLEKGRLSRAEIAIAEIKTENGLANQKAAANAVWVALIVSSILSLLGTVVGTLILHSFFKV